MEFTLLSILYTVVAGVTVATLVIWYAASGRLARRIMWLSHVLYGREPARPDQVWSYYEDGMIKHVTVTRVLSSGVVVLRQDDLEWALRPDDWVGFVQLKSASVNWTLTDEADAEESKHASS